MECIPTMLEIYVKFDSLAYEIPVIVELIEIFVLMIRVLIQNFTEVSTRTKQTHIVNKNCKLLLSH